ncbi:hypothetical protein FGO68_gene15178 [Halteria grandinella]|uniref:Uncharacterized protein n=1 Tax=Halteria grandinella TaxID=5974 RepID=A0A8J8P1M1_HALGN|nr:hypothetical protein FGO68_gene15178 [Halteria grandinella]
MTPAEPMHLTLDHIESNSALPKQLQLISQNLARKSVMEQCRYDITERLDDFNHGLDYLSSPLASLTEDNRSRQQAKGFRMKGVPRRQESTFDKVRLLMNVLPISLIEATQENFKRKERVVRSSQLFQRRGAMGAGKRGSVGV